MKKKVEVDSPVVPLLTGVGTATIAAGAMALCPPLWPLALVCAPLLHRVAKDGVAYDIASATGGEPEEVAKTWEATKPAFERTLEVSKTISSGGALIDLPMTLRYRYTEDKDD